MRAWPVANTLEWTAEQQYNGIQQQQKMSQHVAIYVSNTSSILVKTIRAARDYTNIARHHRKEKAKKQEI